MLAALLPTLENIINCALKHDPDARAKIATLKNQLIKIDCTDWKIVFYIVPDDAGLQFHHNYSGAVNTELKGTLNNFLRIFIKGADTKTLFQYPIEINGNTHNIEILRDAFKNIDLDLEEKLSSILGDGLAHHLFFQLAETKKAIKNTKKKLRIQTKEYIHFEAKHLVSKKQAEQFYTNVATLRDDVERLCLGFCNQEWHHSAAE